MRPLSAATQKQLLTQSDLKLEKALQIAQWIETVEESTNKLQGADSTSSNSMIIT